MVQFSYQKFIATVLTAKKCTIISRILHFYVTSHISDYVFKRKLKSKVHYKIIIKKKIQNNMKSQCTNLVRRTVIKLKVRIKIKLGKQLDINCRKKINGKRLTKLKCN